jgi:hypothetical protein
VIPAKLILLEFTLPLDSFTGTVTHLLTHSFNLLFCAFLVHINLILITARRRLFSFHILNSLLLEACTLVSALKTPLLWDPRR